MAYHHNHHMLQHFTDQQQQHLTAGGDTTNLTSTILPENHHRQLSHSGDSPDATTTISTSKSSNEHHHHQIGAPVWLNNFLNIHGNNSASVSSDTLVAGGGVGGAMSLESAERSGGGVVDWQNLRYKAEVLSAHVSCLRIATSVDQLPRIDAQLGQSQHVVAKYSALEHGNQGIGGGDEKELDQFMAIGFKNDTAELTKA